MLQLTAIQVPVTQYSVIETHNSKQYCTFCDHTEHFIAYYGCRRTMKLFKSLLSECSLTGTCNSVKNCIWGIGDTIRRNSQKTWTKMANLQLTFFHLINNKRYFMSRGGLRSIVHLLQLSSNHLQHHNTYKNDLQKLLTRRQQMIGAINAVQNNCPHYK